MDLDQRIKKWGEAHRREGLREGEQKILLRQLNKRFGDLPRWAQQRLRKAQPEQLERWGEAMLDAKKLEAVFV
jgi:hypothetical protein